MVRRFRKAAIHAVPFGSPALISHKGLCSIIRLVYSTRVSRVGIALACLVPVACGRAPVVWRADLPSPDGVWLASAETTQNGGFGSAHIDTLVYLNQRGTHQAATEVLGFSCAGPVPHPYVLDNVANRGGTIDLRMEWLSPSHLRITYRGNPDLELQVVKFAGVEITVQGPVSAPIRLLQL